MSLKRRDVRFFLDPDDHARLTVLCQLKGIELGEFIEQLLVPAIRSRCDEAIEIVSGLRKRGILRTNAEQPLFPDE